MTVWPAPAARSRTTTRTSSASTDTITGYAASHISTLGGIWPLQGSPPIAGHLSATAGDLASLQRKTPCAYKKTCTKSCLFWVGYHELTLWLFALAVVSVPSCGLCLSSATGHALSLLCGPPLHSHAGRKELRPDTQLHSELLSCVYLIKCGSPCMACTLVTSQEECFFR